MAWSLREKRLGRVGGRESERERELGGDSEVLEGRADEWGREGVCGAKSLHARHASEMH